MYHVGVSNIFELLDDENDEEGKTRKVSAPVKQDTTQSKAKTTVQATKDQPRKNESTPPSKATGIAKVDRSDKRPRAEGEGEGERRGQLRRTNNRDSNRESRPPREPRPERTGAPVGERPPRKDNKEREHGRSFQSGGPQERGKRVYDRKSGTGRGKEVKKGGGGRANWGKEGGENWEEPSTEQQQQQEGEEGKTATSVENTPKEEEKVAPVKEESEEDRKYREEEEKKRKEEEEKEEKMMTLDDYLKKKESEKAEKAAIIPELPAPRQAGEGVDKKELQKWAQFTALKRDEEEEKSGEKKGEKKGDKKRRKGTKETGCSC